jgi:hypothetical protein
MLAYLFLLTMWLELETNNEFGLGRILTMVYVVQNSQNFSGLFPSSCIPKNTTFRKLDVSVLR